MISYPKVLNLNNAKNFSDTANVIENFDTFLFQKYSEVTK